MRSCVPFVWLVVGVAGCGRLGFDARPDGQEQGPDAFEPTSGPWANVIAYKRSMCAIKDTGETWCVGQNYANELTGPRAFAIAPRQLPGQWRTLALSTTSSCGIQLDGTLWCWGDDFYAGIPDGISMSSTMPVKIGADTDWVDVTMGVRHGCARKQDDTLWCWGDNGDRQFHPTMPVATTPLMVRTNVRSVSAALWHTHVVDTDGSLWVAGTIIQGEAGTGDFNGTQLAFTRVGTETSWRAVTTSEPRTCATQADGSLWCTGEGEDGGRGDGTSEATAVRTTFAPVASTASWESSTIGQSHTCARTTDGVAWCFGASTLGQYGDLLRSFVPVEIGPARAIAAGETYTCLVTPTGVLRCAGANHVGTIRQPPATSLRPVALDGGWTKLAAFDAMMCGIDIDNAAWCWGKNAAFNLGTGDGRWQQVPVRLPLDGWQDIAPGGQLSAGIVGGVLYAWGTPPAGLPVVEPTQVSAFTDFVQVTAGASHVCALRGTGELYCWGGNEVGQLGVGDTVARGTPTLVGGSFTQVQAGYTHTCGVSGSASVCWGANVAGSVGDGTTTVRTSPTSVMCATCATRTVKQLALGEHFTLALMNEGSALYGWGDNSYNELGNDTYTSPSTAIELDLGWAQVAAGDAHTCAIGVDGSLWCWGHADEGQLGNNASNPPNAPRIRVGTDNDWASVVAGLHTTCALKQDGTRYCFGSNEYGTYGDGLAWVSGFVAVPLDQ